jgi:hypothetical protein
MSTQYIQIDWTGEEPVHDSTDRCPECKGDMPFTFGVGRPSVYCSAACKMKAYRKRQKALRNTQQLNVAVEVLNESLSEPLSLLNHPWFSSVDVDAMSPEQLVRELERRDYHYCLTVEESIFTGKKYISPDGMTMSYDRRNTRLQQYLRSQAHQAHMRLVGSK